MPVLPVAGRGKAAKIEPMAVWAAMAFPKDETARKHFLARAHEAAVAEAEQRTRAELPKAEGLIADRAGSLFGRLLSPLGGFSVLQAAPTSADMWSAFSAKVWPGNIAGDILLNLLQLRANGIEASVNKAIVIELEYLSKASTPGGDPGGGKSERYVQDAWEAFKPACHLWAAYRIESASLDSPSSLLRQGDLGALLAYSSAFLKMSLSVKSKGRRGYLFSEREMWRVPPRYPLPVIRMSPQPLEDWKLEAVRRKFKSERP